MLTSSISANLTVPALLKVTVNTGTVRDLTTTTWEEALVVRCWEGASQHRTTSVPKLSIALQRVLPAGGDKSVVRLLQAPGNFREFSKPSNKILSTGRSYINITSLNTDSGSCKCLTVPVLTITKGNDGSIRLVEMLHVRIGLKSNLKLPPLR